MMIFLLLLSLPDLPAEERLLEQARRGDQQAIARIYESYFDPLYQFIRWRVNDLGLAEDLTADVFIKFLSALQTEHAPRTSLRGWLFRVARNVLYDHYHQAVPMHELDDNVAGDFNAEAQVLRSLDVEQIRQAVRALSPKQQDVLALRFGQMLSLRETAEILDKSINAVKSLQFRAINALRRVLEEANYDLA